MSNPIISIPRYLSIFKVYLGNKIYLIFALSIFSGFSEGVGFLMLLPLFTKLDSDSSLSSTSWFYGILQNIFNYFGLNGSYLKIFLVLILAYILKGILLFLANYLRAIYTGELLKVLKSKLFKAYTDMKYSYYLKNDSGHFVSLINEEINRSIQSFDRLTSVGLRAIYGVIYLSLGCFTSPRLGLISLVGGFFILTLFKSINNYVTKLSVKRAGENGYLSKLIIQIILSFKYLKATGGMNYLQNDILESINLLSSYQAGTGIASGFSKAVREPIVIIFMFTIVIYEVVILDQPIAPILISIVLFYKGLNSIVGIQGLWQDTLQYMGSTEVVHNEFNTLNDNRERRGSIPIKTFSNYIEFKNVYFSYSDENEYVINDLTLKINKLTTVALIGSSGAGKSTIADLISFIIKANKGDIFIDGKNINQICIEQWRNQISYVSQDSVIFDNTIAFNICMKALDINNEYILYNEVKAAAKKASIDEFIEALPNGYETVVGERGLRLSGGQKQRLFIAREIFKKPRLLILDEATSSLDSKSELLINNSLDTLRGETTILIIAHRLSTIKNVDYLYILERGKIIEKGTYKKLKSDRDSYLSKLISLQEL